MDINSLPNYLKISLLDTNGPALRSFYSILMLVGSLCELHGGFCGGTAELLLLEIESFGDNKSYFSVLKIMIPKLHR